MTSKLKELPTLLKDAFKSWNNGRPFQHSAVVAYYAVLSLPAFIIIILNIVGSVWGEELVRGELLSEISKAIGPSAAEAIRTMIDSQGDGQTSVFATIIGFGTLLYGSTGVFFQLQTALDTIWDQEPNYKNNLIATLVSRAKSFGFILILGFLLLISFILTALLSTFSNQLSAFLPGNLIEHIFLIDLFTSIIFIYALFATMFKFLPSAKVKWKSVHIGALITTFLFLIGKYILALYFNKMQPGTTYGAAGSIILIMLWVSYSSLILLYGAHFTKLYAKKFITDDNIT